ncbi:hypothetical protein N7522_006697 [Penicillium canescens]|nr:hypothetical protein N7522_006697 [Penicillium canescens]
MASENVHDVDALFSKRTGQNSLFDESSIGRIGSVLIPRIQAGPGMISVFGSKKAKKKSIIDLADKQLELAYYIRHYEQAEIDSALKNFATLLITANNEVRRLTEQKVQQTTEEETFANAHFTSIASRLTRVAAVATREPLTVGPSIIEVDDASYLSAEPVRWLDFLT